MSRDRITAIGMKGPRALIGRRRGRGHRHIEIRSRSQLDLTSLEETDGWRDITNKHHKGNRYADGWIDEVRERRMMTNEEVMMWKWKTTIGRREKNTDP